MVFSQEHDSSDQAGLGGALMLPYPEKLPMHRSALVPGVSVLSDYGLDQALLSQWPGNCRAVAEILVGLGWRSGMPVPPRKVRRRPARNIAEQM